MTFSGLIVVGLVVLLEGRQFLVPLYVMAYVALVCATPWPGQFSRHLVPLAPFLTLCLFLGLPAVSDRLERAMPGSWRSAPRLAFEPRSSSRWRRRPTRTTRPTAIPIP